MFKKLKSLVIAVFMAAVVPTLRIPENDNSHDSHSDQPVPPASEPQLPLEQKIKEMEGVLAEKEAEATRAKERVAGLEKTAGENVTRLGELDASLKKTVTGYKALILQSNPEILPELIAGETMEALDNSLAKAKELTNRIKENLKLQVSSLKIPAGAPARGREDNSGLSATEKIRRGLTNK